MKRVVFVVLKALKAIGRIEVALVTWYRAIQRNERWNKADIISPSLHYASS